MNASTPIPFKTQNAVLAYSLYWAGIPEWMPPTNTYDEEILGQLGYRGMELEEAAKLAFEKGQRGRVDFWFERTPELEFFLKAYDDQEAIVKAEGNDTDGAAAGRDMMRRVAGRDLKEGEPVLGEDEALIRIMCIAIKLRPAYINRSKKPEAARLEIAAPGSPRELSSGASGRVVQYPGKKSIPLFASDSLKQKMGVL